MPSRVRLQGGEQLANGMVRDGGVTVPGRGGGLARCIAAWWLFLLTYLYSTVSSQQMSQLILYIFTPSLFVKRFPCNGNAGERSPRMFADTSTMHSTASA